MRLSAVILPIVFAISSALAEETNLTLTVDGVTYENVRWGNVTPSAVTIFHKSGVASIPLEKLPAGLRERFGYDPVKAAQFKQQEQEAQHHWQQKQIAAEKQKKAAQGSLTTIQGGRGPGFDRYTLDEHLALVRAIRTTYEEPRVGDELVHYTAPSKLSRCKMEVDQVVPADSSAKIDCLVVSLVGHYEHRVITNYVADDPNTYFYRSDMRPPTHPEIVDKYELIKDDGSFSFALLVPDVKDYVEGDVITATIVRTGSLSYKDTQEAPRTIAKYSVLVDAQRRLADW